MAALGVNVVEDDRLIIIAVYASPTRPPLEYEHVDPQYRHICS